MSEHGRIAVIPELIWDGRRRLEGHAVLVESGRVVDVVPSAALPTTFPAIRFEGGTLLPGLIDCHVHTSEWMLPGFLAAGVTTVRDTGNDPDRIFELKAQCERSPAAGPSLLACGPLVDGPDVYWKRIGRGHRVGADIRATINDLAAKGADAIKLYVGIDETLMAEAVAAAAENDLRLLAHLGLVDAMTAVRLGVREIQHLSGCVHHVTGREGSGADPEVVDRWADAFLADGVVNCPTLVVWDRIARINEHAFRSDERSEWVHPAVRKAWEGFSHRWDPVETRLARQASVVTMKETINRLNEKGCAFIAGSDAPWPYLAPGFSLHDELALLVDAGLSPHQALVSATSAAADALGVGDRVGRIAPGLDADMIVVNGDPTADISMIGRLRAVMRRGWLIDRETLVETRDRLFAANLTDPASLFITDLDVRADPDRPSA